MSVSIELPKYQCHKQVWALKIKLIDKMAIEKKDGADYVEIGRTWVIIPEDKRYEPFTVDDDYVTAHKPVNGGYYVVYEDGYKSFSPADAFESGYTLL